MAKISSYSILSPTLSDILIGTDVEGGNATKNFRISDILSLIPVSTLQSVLNAGNTATQNIVLTGNITSTRIIPTAIQDRLGNIGTNGQVLSKDGTGIVWSNPSAAPGLDQVLAQGDSSSTKGANVLFLGLYDAISDNFEQITFNNNIFSIKSLANISLSSLSTARTYTLPNKNGTFAMLSDIPTGGGVQSVTGFGVDNTNPLNPIVNKYEADSFVTATGTTYGNAYQITKAITIIVSGTNFACGVRLPSSPLVNVPYTVISGWLGGDVLLYGNSSGNSILFVNGASPVSSIVLKTNMFYTFTFTGYYWTVNQQQVNGVQGVTGFGVDNTNPLNPVVNKYGYDGFFTATGTDYGSATQIIDAQTIISGGAANTGVYFTPTAGFGDKYFIGNNTATVKKIYGGINDLFINGVQVSGTTGITINPNTIYSFTLTGYGWLVNQEQVKAYTSVALLLNQNSTNIPFWSEIYNDTGGSISAVRNSVGNYTFTFFGSVPAIKIFPMISGVTPSSHSVSIVGQSTSQVSIATYQNNLPSDDILAQTPFKVEFYR